MTHACGGTEILIRKRTAQCHSRLDDSSRRRSVLRHFRIREIFKQLWFALGSSVSGNRMGRLVPLPDRLGGSSRRIARLDSADGVTGTGAPGIDDGRCRVDRRFRVGPSRRQRFSGNVSVGVGRSGFLGEDQGLSRGHPRRSRSLSAWNLIFTEFRVWTASVRSRCAHQNPALDQRHSRTLPTALPGA